MTVHDWRAALRRLEGAYSDNTIRTYRSDVQAYEAWCVGQGIDLFPASSEMIANFISARAPFDAASTSNIIAAKRNPAPAPFGSSQQAVR